MGASFPVLVFESNRRGVVSSVRKRWLRGGAWADGDAVQITYCHDMEPTALSVWETPRTIYGVEEDGM